MQRCQSEYGIEIDSRIKEQEIYAITYINTSSMYLVPGTIHVMYTAVFYEVNILTVS